MSLPAAARAGPETDAAPRTVRDLDAPPVTVPVLAQVPRPVGDATVMPLDHATAGGLEAVQAEWSVDGGTVVLTGKAPFADLTGRAGFRSDGALDGTVQMRARVGLLGLDLGEATWSVDGWTPGTPLAAPEITLRGAALAIDLRPLPPGAAWSANKGVSSARTEQGATIDLPGGVVPPGQPLSPRIAEVYRGLLNVDPSALRVHVDAPVAGAPAFVTNADLFFAPGMYGADSPEALRVLDAAVRTALKGLSGPVAGPPPQVVAPAPRGAPAPEADTTPVPANVPAGPPPAEAAAARQAARTDEQAAQDQESHDDAARTAAARGEDAQAGAETDSAAATAGAESAGAVPAAAEGADGSAAGPEAAPPPVELIMPEPPTELSPTAQARGGAVAAAAGGAAHSARNLPSADTDVSDSRAAVPEPAAETSARAREELAAELGDRPAPSPEIVELCERIRTAIRENRPEDEDQLLETDPTQEAQRAGSTVTSSVQGQVDEVGGSYDAMASPPAGTPDRTAAQIQEPSSTPEGIRAEAASAAPDPIPPENTTLDADVAATDERIAQSGIDTRVTREIPDGPFTKTRDARGQLGQAAQQTPQQIQAEQQQAIDSAQADMAQLQLQAVTAMRAARSGAVSGVGNQQTGMVASEGQTRESVSRHAQQTYDDAQHQVDQLLQPLGRTAIARWEAGLTRLSQDFHDSLDRVKRWIDDRHSGVGGTILAIGDYIGGLPGWVTDEYNRAERQFGDGVCDLLTSISSDVNGVVAAAKAIIQHARDEIDAAFKAMEDQFPEWAAQERARFGGMLDGLDQHVTQAQTSFVRDVSQRAITAVNQVHAEAQALRDEAGGLIGRVVAAIKEFIDDPIRAIINGLLRLVGIPPGAFWALIARIEQVISDIADDPETFINNLVEGVKQGFQQFFDNFGTHVLKGFWDWLFSGLKTPIPMPRDLSATSLFTFALQLMGITWARVREILVRHIGPTAVEVIEAAWRLISVLIDRGPGGLVDLIKEQLSPENIVNTILEAAVQYLTETLIQQVIVRVIGLLNPVGAIAQAIDLIYQVCSWIFRNAARIFRFVEAVVNGMADVIAGNVTGLATKVEQALASLIPPVIDFLAGLLHLGGLPGEVAEVITRLQTMVLAVMDRVIGFLAEQGRTLLRRLGVGEEQPGHGDTELGTVVRFRAAGESHRLFPQREGSAAELMVASTPTAIPEWISRWKGKLAEGKPTEGTPERKEAEDLLGELGPAATSAGAAATALIAGFDAAERDPEHKTSPPDDSGVEAAEHSIANMLDRLFELFGENDQLGNLKAIRTALPPAGAERTEAVLTQWKQDFIGVPRAKPLNGAEAPVWDVAAFDAGALLPSEVLASNTHQMALLPFFERRKHEPVPSSAFTAYALQDAGAGHQVRTAFLRSLGSRVAADLRRDAFAAVGTTASDETLGRIRRLNYVPGAGDGSFSNPFQQPVEVLVKGMFADADFMAVLEAIVQSPVQGVSYDEFATAVRASKKTRKWLKEELRGVQLGQHEWLPRSLIMDVLDHAADLNKKGDVTSAVGWVRLLGSLRSPTDSVIFPLRVMPVTVIKAPGQVEERGVSKVAGHAGALVFHPDMKRDEAGYEERLSLAYRAGFGRGGQFTLTSLGGLTKGTGSFHDALRAFFRDNAASMTPAAWVDALLAYLPKILYTGEDLPIPEAVWKERIGVFVTLPGGAAAGDMTVRQFADFARARWTQIQADFQQAKKGLPQ